MIAAIALAASAGVGAQSNPVCITAQAGSSAAAQLYITGTGTQAETVTVTTFAAGGEGQALHRGQRRMPAGWVHVSYPRKWLVIPQSTVSLQPGGSAYLQVSVTVPAGTPRGMYVVNLWAHTASARTGSGRQVVTGAGAAALLYAGVGETPSCTVPAPVRQAGSPDQYVPAGAVTPQSSQGLTSGGTEGLVVVAAIFAVYTRITRRRG